MAITTNTLQDLELRNANHNVEELLQEVNRLKEEKVSVCTICAR